MSQHHIPARTHSILESNHKDTIRHRKQNSEPYYLRMSIFSFLFFALSVTCGNSRARDQNCATAVTWAMAVTGLDPWPLGYQEVHKNVVVFKCRKQRKAEKRFQIKRDWKDKGHITAKCDSGSDPGNKISIKCNIGQLAKLECGLFVRYWGCSHDTGFGNGTVVVRKLLY